MAPIEYFIFFNDAATTAIYTLSLHDALPISDYMLHLVKNSSEIIRNLALTTAVYDHFVTGLISVLVNAVLLISLGVLLVCRSEEHTSELQSQFHLVCRLLLEKKKDKTPPPDS